MSNVVDLPTANPDAEISPNMVLKKLAHIVTDEDYEMCLVITRRSDGGIQSWSSSTTAPERIFLAEAFKYGELVEYFDDPSKA